MLLALCIAIPAGAATGVGGTLASNTVWTTNGSPYLITNATFVPQNGVLAIEPGVTIQFRTTAPLTVYGSLIAEGATNQLIRFEPEPGTTNRGALVFDGAGFSALSTGVLANCAFTGLLGLGGILSGHYIDLTITDCVFSNIAGKVIYPTDAQVNMLRNVTRNTAEAINTVYCKGVIASNDIEGVNGDADAIDVDFAWRGPGDGPLLVEWNHVAGGAFSNADGIDFGTSSNVVARYNVVHAFGDKGFSIGERSQLTAYNNLIYNCVNGIAIKDSSTPILMNFTIADCAVGVNSYEKNSGVGGGKGSITNFVIGNCATPIKLDAKSTLAVGYSVLPGAVPWPGPGNRSGDAQFVDATAHDYRLRPGSPAIDGGTNLPWMATATDLGGATRVEGAQPDCGAYEYRIGPLRAGFTGTPRSGLSPLEVVFTASVGGTNLVGVGYAWDLEADGTNDAAGPDLVVVTNTYTAVGAYSVRLTVTNAAGEIDTFLQPGYVTVNAVTNPVPATTLYVAPDNSTPVPPYSSWATAATNVAAALAIASNGATIWLTNGLHRVPGGVIVNRAITIRGAGPAAAVVLDGVQTGRVASLAHSGAVLADLTITGGRAATGAGVLLATGLLERCIIRDNVATGNGGGFWLEPGGILRDCLITNNASTTGYGGGGFLHGGGLIENGLFLGNEASAVTGGRGGACYMELGGTVRNCVLAGNRAGERAGGAALHQGGLLESCTVVNNSAPAGSGVRCSGGGTVRNCIVQNNQPQASNTFNTAPGFLYTYTCVYPAVAGIGNITNDPQIVISDDGRFPLAPTSPCIDTGTNIAGVTRDWAGVPRPLDGNADGTARADMGAFEFVNTGADSDGDGMPDGWELGHGLNPVTNDAGGDADVDAFANLAEYVAGTDPGDATARLSVVRVDALPTGLVLDWDSASNRLYTVEARPQWNAAWSNASAILPGTGSALSYTSSIPDATGLFYRIRVALPPVP